VNITPREKSVVSFLEEIRYRICHGMTLYSISLILRNIGIEFTPYILLQEDTNFTQIPEIKGITSDYSFELLGPEDMKILGTLKSGFSENEFLDLLNNGEKCFVLKHNGEIAAFLWINFMRCSYKSTNFNLKNNEAYLWFMYTIKSYRGKNLAPYLKYKSYEILKKMGRDVIYSVVEYLNSPAVNSKKKLNAKKMKLMLFIELFKKNSWSFTIKSY